MASLEAATVDSSQDRAEIEEIASALGSPAFAPARVTKAIGELAQALARVERSQLADDPALRNRLQEMARVLDTFTTDPAPE
jgi:hypothetical protein